MRIGLFCCFMCLLACSDREIGDGSGDDGGTATGDDGGTGDDGAPGCEAYRNESDFEAVPVSIVNDGSDAVFLTGPASCQSTHLRIEGQNGENWSGTHCVFTCESLMTGACSCTAECPIAPVIRIEPGGTFETSWPGMVLVPSELPEACGDENCGDGTCGIARHPSEGSYTFTVALANEPSCTDDDCTCADGEQVCEVDAYGAPADRLVEQTVMLPADNVKLAVP